MSNYRSEDLSHYCASVFTAAGVAHERAHILAESMVHASLRGVESHGVSRTTIYLKRIAEGMINPNSELVIEQKSSSSALIDARNTIGQYASLEASELAAELASLHGIGCVGVRRSNHFGAASFYTIPLARRGFIAIAMSNAPTSMALWGAAKPYTGTNPLSYSVPAGKYEPVTLDMATSIVARGKIRRAWKQGETIPEGWAIDSDGNPTVDPEKALEGFVLPFGGVKGSAIALFIEILAGVLTGAAFGPSLGSMYNDFTKEQGLGHFFLAIDPGKFFPSDGFSRRMETMLEEIRALPASPGNERIFLPGEKEGLAEKERSLNGIPLEHDVEAELQDLGRRYEILFPKAIEN